MKVMKRIVSLVLTIFLWIGSVGLPANAATRQQKTGIGFVDASSLRLRSGPGSNYATVDFAARDEVVVILEKTGQWYKVIYNLQEGYMHGSYLDVADKENAELGYGRVNGSSVNVRSGPGTGYSVKARAATDDKVYILGINKGWFKVIYGSIIGYIRSDYVDLTEIPYENKDSENTPRFYVRGKSTGLTPSAAALQGVSGSAVVATAKQYIGTPYLWGGVTPGGFDCSGYVRYVFDRNGISLPRTSAQQYKVGNAVSKSNLQQGDLVFFATSGSGVNHVGIWIGNGQFIHCGSSTGVTVSQLSSTYWSVRYIGARRVL